MTTEQAAQLIVVLKEIASSIASIGAILPFYAALRIIFSKD